MKKGSFISDTFERLDLGEGIKNAAKPLVQMPTKMLDTLINSDQGRTSEVEERSGKTSEVKGNKHTPLDFQKLQKKYANQDEQKTKELRNRLFQLVKSGEEKTAMKIRQEELEKKRKEEYEAADKKKKELEKKKQEQMAGTPQGKTRRSIFSHKKVAQREQAEVRPATGKQ